MFPANFKRLCEVAFNEAISAGVRVLPVVFTGFDSEVPALGAMSNV